jgi:glycosyltransferase involved in cell wall biosynthesis
MEIHVRLLSETLAKKGNKVYLISSGFQAKNSTDNLEEFRLLNFRGDTVGIVPFLILSFIMALILNKRNDFDIIHLHGPPSMKLEGEFLAKLTKKKIVYTIHGEFVPSKKIKWFLTLFGQQTRIIAVSESIKNVIAREYSIYNTLIIPSGIDCLMFKKNQNRERNKNVLFLGNLSKDKGAEYLILGFPRVLNKFPDANLYIIGNGPEKSKLKNLVSQLDISRNIIFQDAVDHEVVPNIMAAMDIFVIPSIQTSDSIEGTPTVIIEAMASGLPVIGTKVGGIPFLIEEGKNGSIVSEKNPDELAGTIIDYFSNSDTLSKISKNNIEKSKSYDWNIVSDRILNIAYSGF